MQCSTRQPVLGNPFGLAHRVLSHVGDSSATALGALTVTDSNTHVRFDFDVPGFDTSEITIDLQDGELIVAGESAGTEDSDHVVYSERRRRSFRRAIRLSDKLDPATTDAELRDGVLTLTIARRPEAERRRIEIRGTGDVTPDEG